MEWIVFSAVLFSFISPFVVKIWIAKVEEITAESEAQALRNRVHHFVRDTLADFRHGDAGPIRVQRKEKANWQVEGF